MIDFTWLLHIRILIRKEVRSYCHLSIQYQTQTEELVRAHNTHRKRPLEVPESIHNKPAIAYLCAIDQRAQIEVIFDFKLHIHGWK